MEDGEQRLYATDMGKYGLWDIEHPATAVTGEFVLHFRREFLKCDECGKDADAVHLIDNDETITVKFSCPEHDFGNYTVDFDGLFKPNERFLTHIAEKTWGLRAMAALEERLDQIDREQMIAAGVMT